MPPSFLQDLVHSLAEEWRLLGACVCTTMLHTFAGNYALHQEQTLALLQGIGVTSVAAASAALAKSSRDDAELDSTSDTVLAAIHGKVVSDRPIDVQSHPSCKEFQSVQAAVLTVEQYSVYRERVPKKQDQQQQQATNGTSHLDAMTKNETRRKKEHSWVVRQIKDFSNTECQHLAVEDRTGRLNIPTQLASTVPYSDATSTYTKARHTVDEFEKAIEKGRVLEGTQTQTSLLTIGSPLLVIGHVTATTEGGIELSMNGLRILTSKSFNELVTEYRDASALAEALQKLLFASSLGLWYWLSHRVAKRVERRRAQHERDNSVHSNMSFINGPNSRSMSDFDHDDDDDGTSSGERTEKCVICLERRRVIALLPCGHRVLCGQCFDSCQTQPNRQFSCPVCRSVVGGGVRVFDA